MDRIGSVDDIIDLFGKKDSSTIYLDKAMNKKGIDYTRFLKIKYDSINKGLIKDLYTVDGWYILFWLMSSGGNAYYTTTTMNMITEFTSIRATKVKDTLLHLHNKGVICLVPEDGSVLDIKNNTVLNICILYHSDCNYIYTDVKEGNGYIAVPMEFLKNILPMISSTQWGIYSVLLINYSFFGVWSDIDSESGETVYKYHREHYSYPTIRQISESLGMNKETINLAINELGENEYNLIKIVHTEGVFAGKAHIRGGNNRYRIPLLERVEWCYYNLYKHLSEEQHKYHAYIKTMGFENVAFSSNQGILTNKNYLYILEYYQNVMIDYNNTLITEDKDKYKYILENYSVYL